MRIYSNRLIDNRDYYYHLIENKNMTKDITHTHTEINFWFSHLDSSVFVEGFNTCHCALSDSPDRIVDQ
jgi:hypothetical protein